MGVNRPDLRVDLLATDDAHEWARQFVEKVKVGEVAPDNNGAMTIWFSAAIETGYSAGYLQGQEDARNKIWV